MASMPLSLSLMLYVSIFCCLHGLAIGRPHGNKHYRHDIAVRDAPDPTTTSPFSTFTSVSPCFGTSCATSTSTPVSNSCDNVSGNVFARDSDSTGYTIICDTDFPGQDIYPFLLSGSFEECLNHCEEYNTENAGSRCRGFVFAPGRVNYSDDCYLKSSLDNPFPASIHLVGATVVSPTSAAASMTTVFAVTLESSPASTSTDVSSATSTHEQASTSIRLGTPVLKEAKLLGISSNNPTKQYVSHLPATPQKLASQMMVPGINLDLVNNYPMAGDTGSWNLGLIEAEQTLADLSIIPHMSRDGGKGGTINGSHLFIFCDTANFDGDQMVGFVSSSVATDVDMNGRKGEALNLVDHVGEWQDDVGRMRGFAPMTAGEESFNIKLSGDGYRYAVWPESSLISLNKTHALIYAPLVYDEVDMTTQEANFTTIGNTLLVVSVDPTYGPYADRVVPQLFNQDEITYGSLGGIREWGPSGVGGNDGNIYLFGQVPNGVFVAKTNPIDYANLISYSYWDGGQWAANMPNYNDEHALLLNESVMDFEMVYAPAYNTFIMIYLTPNADNTFYHRVLRPGSDTGILPPYEKGGDPKYVERIVGEGWSQEYVLYEAPTPNMGYIYAGGLHAGYFGDDDITNGGYKGLLSWTEHTGEDASSPGSGYAHKTVMLTFA